MKAEETDLSPVVDLRTPDGIRPQSDSSDVIAVLFSDGSGNWTNVVPGSFHFWVTNPDGGRSVPYIQFETQNPVTEEIEHIECFPTSCAAFKYRAKPVGDID